MDPVYRVGTDVSVLPSQLVVPGVGNIPINAFVLHAEQPMLIDTGLSIDEPAFVDALRSVIDPADLRWIWLTHDDSDHTGSLQTVLGLAPSAKLATHGFSAVRMNTQWPVPLDRVHAVAVDDRLDLGDRTVRAFRPPTFDNPMTTGLLDESTATLFSVDSFGAILPRTDPDIDAYSAEELAVGMTTWATFDSPWLHLTDRNRLAHVLNEIRRLAPERVLGSHLPPAIGRLESLLGLIASIPDADPFVAPDAESFSLVAEAITASS